mgnify:CR=1 FL=1
MPFFNDMWGLLQTKLVKGKESEYVFNMKKDTSLRCIKGQSHEYTKLYLRGEKRKYHYIGYLCKECRKAYFVITKYLRLKTDHPNNSLGSYGVGGDGFEEKPEYKTLQVNTKQYAKAVKLLKKKRFDVRLI